MPNPYKHWDTDSLLSAGLRILSNLADDVFHPKDRKRALKNLDHIMTVLNRRHPERQEYTHMPNINWSRVTTDSLREQYHAIATKHNHTPYDLQCLTDIHEELDRRSWDTVDRSYLKEMDIDSLHREKDNLEIALWTASSSTNVPRWKASLAAVNKEIDLRTAQLAHALARNNRRAVPKPVEQDTIVHQGADTTYKPKETVVSSAPKDPTQYSDEDLQMAIFHYTRSIEATDDRGLIARYERAAAPLKTEQKRRDGIKLGIPTILAELKELKRLDELSKPVVPKPGPQLTRYLRLNNGSREYRVNYTQHEFDELLVEVEKFPALRVSTEWDQFTNVYSVLVTVTLAGYLDTFVS